MIAPGPLADYVPVCTRPPRAPGPRPTARTSIITQYDMNALEKVGMLKMDFLGLKTLTVIHDARADDRRAAPATTLDMDALAVRRPRRSTSCCAQGRTAGVFQFESPLATDMLRGMRCDRFDDLVASNALLRPGPLDAGHAHASIIRRKLRRGAGHLPASPSSRRSSSRPTASSPIRSR